MNRKITLEDKLVGNIASEFFIPSYQRGYRWESKQVETLLDDILDNGNKPYCLQPVVVRKVGDKKYELIDGQQRMTTLFIIMKYLKELGVWSVINYSLEYETRKKSATFLQAINAEEANDNIDFYFIYNAYQTVVRWFDRKCASNNRRLIGSKLQNSFMEQVKVIWYEVQEVDDKDAIALFTRLNIGSIPLTNAELVKALFLCRRAESDDKQQNEIAVQWDTIERELHDEDFWNFITTESEENYPSRIELIFNLMVPSEKRSADKYSTFFYFSERRDNLQLLWKDITIYYYRLKEWFKKDALYHKIGYLVASKYMQMNDIVDATVGLKKSEIELLLDDKIRESIRFPRTKYSELRYDSHYDYISRLLLLFNVVSIMNRTGGIRFPFKLYNTEKWSLEHIHPQHPETMKNDQKLWRTWIEKHLHSIQELPETDENAIAYKKSLLEEMQNTLKKEKMTGDDFNSVVTKVMNSLSDKSNDDLTHSFSNMALLQADKNSALNNSLFDVKRRQIIEMDRRGEYIPYCTRMVFLKYYTQRVDDKQMFVWSHADREDYINAMNVELKPYLAERIEA